MDSIYGNLTDIPEPFRSFNFAKTKAAAAEAPIGEISDDLFFMLLLLILL